MNEPFRLDHCFSMGRLTEDESRFLRPSSGLLLMHGWAFNVLIAEREISTYGADSQGTATSSKKTVEAT